MSTLPSGYEGVILSGEQPSITNLPQAFAGIVLIYNQSEKFIKIQSNRGVPIIGASVQVTNVTNPSFIAITDSSGFIAGKFDTSGNIQIKVTSGRTFYNFIIDGGNQQITTTFIFPIEFI